MEARTNLVVLVYIQSRVFLGYKTPYQEEHLGLAYLAASLNKNNIETFIIRSGEYSSNSEMERKIIELKPLLIGFSPSFLTINEVLECARRIKKSNSGIHITLGGRQVSFTAEEILKNENFIDSVIRGEGEETLKDLICRLRENLPLHGCLGVCYRDASGRVYRNPNRPLVENLDRFPFPVRTINSNSSYRWVQMVTSRGCIHQCSFCTTPNWLEFQCGTRRRRVRSPENVIEEMSQLAKRGVSTFNFTDEDFIGTTKEDKERVKKIAQLIIENRIKIRWRALWGAITLKPERDRDFLQILKASGLEQVGIGIEAGNSSALKVFKKPTTPEINKRACQFLTENNVFPKIGFIMFHPYAVFEGLKQNAEFLGEIGQACYLRYFLKSIEVHHGTEIKVQLERDGLLKSMTYRSDDYQYSFVSPLIDPFAKAMRKLLVCSEVIGLNNVLYLADIATIRLVDQRKLPPHFELYCAIRRKLGEFNVKSFLAWISLAQEGWHENTWNSILSDYLRYIKIIISKIEGFNYKKYLD